MADATESNRTDCNDPAGPPAAPARRWARTLGIGAAIAAACLPLDPIIAGVTRGLRLGGDLRREMEFVQQFGAITSCIIIAIVILLLDPRAKKYLAKAVIALVANAAAVFALKCLIGRARPKLEEPYHFGGPWTAFQLPDASGSVQPVYAWEFWRKGVADLWSLPSSHTAAAFALAAVLSWFYPKLRVLVIPLAVVVGVCRVLFSAHYVSDVVVGGTIGWVVAGLVMGPRER